MNPNAVELLLNEHHLYASVFERAVNCSGFSKYAFYELAHCHMA